MSGKGDAKKGLLSYLLAVRCVSLHAVSQYLFAIKIDEQEHENKRRKS